METRDREIASKQTELNQLSDEKSRLDFDVAELRGHIEKQTRELELLEGKFGKLQGQYHQLTQYNDQLGEEMEQRNRELKLKEEELASVKQESNKVRGLCVVCRSVTSGCRWHGRETGSRNE